MIERGKWMVLAAGALALAGCARTDRPAAASAGAGVRSIAYETSRCFGRCPVYQVTVNDRGEGVFVGKQFTAVEGERRFAVTPAQFGAFAGALERYRPAAGERLVTPDHPDCGAAATDLPSADVRWTGPGGDQHLQLYFGCGNARADGMVDAVGKAPDLLPLETLIGARP